MNKNKMTSRKRLINLFNKQKIDHVPCSPASVGFFEKHFNVEDGSCIGLIKAAHKIGMDPFFGPGFDFPEQIQNVWKKEIIPNNDGDIRHRETIKTTKGTLTRVLQTKEYAHPWMLEYPLKSIEDLPAFEYILTQSIEIVSSIDTFEDITQAAAYVEEAETGVILVWLSIPIELLGWMDRADSQILAMDYPDKMKELSDLIHNYQLKLAEIVLRSGADMIIVGIPGIELTSPVLLDKYAFPYAGELIELAGSMGKWSHFHMCGKTKTLLSKIKELNPTILETLSPPPEGNIDNLAEAREILGNDVIMKGNMNITFLNNATPDEVYNKGLEIIQEAGKRNFILGVSDTLNDYHPVENVKALIKAAHDSPVDVFD
jgi:hypothetical protein